MSELVCLDIKEKDRKEKKKHILNILYPVITAYPTVNIGVVGLRYKLLQKRK